MEKRYQVFVSSTFSDLQDERQEVMQALLELDCIPAGMELFPAANDDQWTLIKRVIDDCDYYIVIIAGKYGSVGSGGQSYTEMEYRYALEKKKPIMAFLHKDPGSLKASLWESDQGRREKLETFRNLAREKMCRFWTSAAELGSQVSRSLITLIKNNPAVGWVRGDQLSDSSAEEILRLKRRIEELEAGLRAASTEFPPGTEGLAQGSDAHKFDLDVIFRSKTQQNARAESWSWEVESSWNEIFAAVSPIMIDEASDADFRKGVALPLRRKAYDEILKSKEGERYKVEEIELPDAEFQKIKVQLKALGLITKNTKPRSVRDTETYWTLTPFGDTVMTRLVAISRPTKYAAQEASSAATATEPQKSPQHS
jgi:hypothetical protein